MIELVLVREYKSENCTIGALWLDGIKFCHTLEDAVQDHKIAGRTCIPEGKYRVVMDWSPRFKQFMPHVLDVPGFEGIRIHPGNSDADTEGCILVGTWNGKAEFIGNSRLAYTHLLGQIEDDKDISLTIRSAE